MTRSVVVALVGLVLSGSTAAPAQPPSDGDRWLTRPVDDRTFATYLEFFIIQAFDFFTTAPGMQFYIDGLTIPTGW